MHAQLDSDLAQVLESWKMMPSGANISFCVPAVKGNSFKFFTFLFFPPSEKHQNCHGSGPDLCHDVFRHNLSPETPRNQNRRGVQGSLSPPAPLVNGGESETLGNERWAQVTQS